MDVNKKNTPVHVYLASALNEGHSTLRGHMEEVPDHEKQHLSELYRVNREIPGKDAKREQLMQRLGEEKTSRVPERRVAREINVDGI